MKQAAFIGWQFAIVNGLKSSYQKYLEDIGISELKISSEEERKAIKKESLEIAAKIIRSRKINNGT